MKIEKKISNVDLFKNIFLKWRFIVVFAVLGAVLLDGYGMFRNYRGMSANTVVVEEEQILDKLHDSLTQQEAAEVESAASVYQVYSQKYESIMEYNENSLLMRTDANCVPTMQLDYYIKDNVSGGVSTDSEYMRLNDIRKAYQSRLQDIELYAELLKSTEADFGASYIEELISFASDSQSMESANVSVSVIADTKENCEKIAEYVEEAIQQVTPELKGVYGDFDLISYNKSYSVQVNQTVAVLQKTQIDQLASLRGSVNTLTNYFSEDQSSYYLALLNDMELETNVAENTSEETEISAEEMSNASSSIHLQQLISRKYVLLGAILGILCSCFVFMLQYIINNNLHIAKDIQEYFQVQVLGELKIMTYRKGLDSKICALFGDKRNEIDEETELQIISEKVKIYTEKNNLKSIYISSCYMDDSVNKVAQQLKANLALDISTINIGTITKDAEAFKKMVYSDGLILIETVGKSSYNEIFSEIEQAQNNSVQIIGCIVLS